jgi:hypothetical protein
MYVYIYVCVFTQVSDLIGRSMTTPPPVLSPGRILQPLTSQSVSITRENLAHTSKIVLKFFFNFIRIA